MPAPTPLSGKVSTYYQILDKLGEGGMGEVWKARDTRLNRTVAIKFCKCDLDERFHREAQAIAALNHPHVCTLYDVGPDYLVMEFVDGRRVKGPLTPDQAIPVAIQIADALDAAHSAGIVHRDLKPANVMLTKSGVKLLDFGLAKQCPRDAPGLSDQTATMSLTREGTIMGTPQYMSPEQAEGRKTDARSDIFAFGCVLYEMLTGYRAFEAKCAAGLIAAILTAEPTPMHERQPLASPALEHVVKTCLAKQPDDRWQSARDLKHALQALMTDRSRAATTAGNQRSAIGAAWIIAGLMLVAAVVFAAAAFRRAPAGAPARFGINPGDVSVRISQRTTPVVSPDGRRIVLAALGPDGESRLWLRALDSDQLQAIPGTEGAHDPFWSPDSRSIAFGASQVLKRVELDGGAPRTICASNMVYGGAWNRNGVLLFGGQDMPIYRVPAQGGEPRAVTRLNTAEGDQHHVAPAFLPDDEHFLYAAWGTPRTPVRVASLSGGAEATLPISQAPFAYVEPGYLLFPVGRSILAQRFNLRRLQLEGEPLRVGDPVAQAPGLAFHSFSVSGNGVLVWRTGIGPNVNRLVWVDASGRELGVVGKPADYSNPALSPDGSRLAVDIRDPVTGKRDIWVFDLRGGSATRFTSDPADDSNAVWSPDARQIAFTSDRKGTRDLYVKPTDGSGKERLLLESPAMENAESWSPDGRLLLYNRQQMTETRVLTLVLDPKAAAKSQPLLPGPGMQSMSQVCPSGKRVAYMSNDSGREEIYIQDFPTAAGRRQISDSGGAEPQWSADGRRVYYLQRSRSSASLMAADVNPAPSTFAVQRPRRMFEFQPTPPRRNSYAVSGRSDRFLLVKPVLEEPPAPITVMLNWQMMLKR